MDNTADGQIRSTGYNKIIIIQLTSISEMKKYHLFLLYKNIESIMQRKLIITNFKKCEITLPKKSHVLKSKQVITGKKYVSKTWKIYIFILV